ncbi:MAG: hypothetical protein PHR53_09835 [Bacteroidales bacterium]|nr:hypothetical protein [Bacteroidales bacterium]
MNLEEHVGKVPFYLSGFVAVGLAIYLFVVFTFVAALQLWVLSAVGWFLFVLSFQLPILAAAQDRQEKVRREFEATYWVVRHHDHRI